MRFQTRDGHLLKRVHYFGDGVLARRHIRRIFWEHSVDDRAMQRRLKILREADYITWPSPDQYRYERIPEPVIYLGWRGILWVAEQSGVEVEPPKNDRENQMRDLEKRLRKKQIHWKRIGGFSRLKHNIAVTDVKLAFEISAGKLTSFSLLETTPESILRSYGDRVEYSIEGGDGKVREGERGVIPDSFLVLANEERKARGQEYLFLLPLEVDMSTHTVRSRKNLLDFGSKKAAPYAAYISSPQYKSRFGHNAGRWLVVTTGKRRRENLMKRTGKVTGKFAQLFCFSTFDELGLPVPKQAPTDEGEVVNVLSDPVWWQVGESEPLSLDAI